MLGNVDFSSENDRRVLSFAIGVAVVVALQQKQDR